MGHCCEGWLLHVELIEEIGKVDLAIMLVLMTLTTFS